MKKKVNALLSIFVAICILISSSLIVMAADLVKSTPLPTSGVNVTDSIKSNTQKDYYKIVLPYAGKLELTITNANNTAQTTEPKFLLHDELFSDSYGEFSIKSIGVPATQIKDYYLYGGTYFLEVNANNSTGYNVILKATYTSVDTNVTSAIENPAGAINVDYNKTYHSLKAYGSHFLYYRITVPTKSRVELTSYQDTELVYCFVDSTAQNEITRAQFDAPSGVNSAILDEGTYYLRFGGSGLFYSSYDCLFSFIVKMEPVIEKPVITKMKMDKDNCTCGTGGFIIQWSKCKNAAGYRVEVEEGYNNWRVIGTTTSTKMYIYRASYNNYFDYRVVPYNIYNGNKYDGDASESIEFYIDSKYQKAHKFSKSRKTCKVCGQTNPYYSKPTEVKKIKPRKKAFKLSWKRRSNVGYQIQYSTNKKFKKANKVTFDDSYATSYVFRNLKSHKKYYVRIRTFVYVDGKRHYSVWSKVKSVKTK